MYMQKGNTVQSAVGCLSLCPVPGYWLWWHTGDGIGPTQPSPAQPSQPRQAAEDGDMQHTATADNLMLGTLRYL